MKGEAPAACNPTPDSSRTLVWRTRAPHGSHKAVMENMQGDAPTHLPPRTSRGL